MQVKVTLKSRIPQIQRNVVQVLEELLDVGKDTAQTKWSGDVRVDTGEYRDSIKAIKPGPKRRIVQSDVAHSIPNEYGTSRMSARPSARRAAQEAARAIRETARRKKVL